MRVFVTGTRVHMHLTVSRSPLDPLSYQLLYSLTHSSLHQFADLFIKTVEWNYLLKTLMLLMDFTVRRWSGKDSHKTERVAPILNHIAFCVSDFMSVKQRCLLNVYYIPVIMELDTSAQYVILFSNLMDNFFIKSIVFLYMFRALLCSSSGGLNCIYTASGSWFRHSS